MATYFLAYLGYKKWTNSQTTAAKEEEQQYVDRSADILDVLRQVNKRLWLFVIICLTIILLLLIAKKLVNARKSNRSARNGGSIENYDCNC